MSSADTAHVTDTLFALFWQALAGGSYDLTDLEQRFDADSTFQEFLIDSLDLTDFLLRVSDHFGVRVPLEQLPHLGSLKALEAYIRVHRS
jgi:acyl carrier protein